jgi:hypothetical protein
MSEFMIARRSSTDVALACDLACKACHGSRYCGSLEPLLLDSVNPDNLPGIYVFHPTIPGYPKARFPGVASFPVHPLWWGHHDRILGSAWCLYFLFKDSNILEITYNVSKVDGSK